jgi:hypothetical protein
MRALTRWVIDRWRTAVFRTVDGVAGLGVPVTVAVSTRRPWRFRTMDAEMTEGLIRRLMVYEPDTSLKGDT